jgi:hypothetical protein
MNMSKELKKDWLPKLQARYGRRSREGKSRMLNELCEDYKYERKYAIKLLRVACLCPPGGFTRDRSGSIRWLNRWCDRSG